MSQNENNEIMSSEVKKSNEEGVEESENVNNTNQNLESQNLNNEAQNKNIQNQQDNTNNNGNEVKEGENNVPAENNYDYEQNKKEIMEKIEIRKQQADTVEKYIYETGIGTSFQIIFSELISKKIPVENYYTYTASRLRQIGREKEALDRRNKKK